MNANEKVSDSPPLASDNTKTANGEFAAPLGSATDLRAKLEAAHERLREDPCTQNQRALSDASDTWRAAINRKESPNGGTQRRRDENAPPATGVQSRRSLQ